MSKKTKISMSICQGNVALFCGRKWGIVDEGKSTEIYIARENNRRY
jgi:hypothetical protein